MNFSTAIDNQEARTDNGMKARKASANPNVDLFFKIGASRGQNILPDFITAYVKNSDLALRTLQWARDVRGGAGERDTFRKLLLELGNNYPVTTLRILDKIPEIGRWDDLLLDFNRAGVRQYGFDMIFDAITDGNALAAKWTPRKGPKAIELRNHWGMSPKQYRKFIVNASNTVEQKMCAREWDSINFSHVPSLAANNYRTAFYKNCETRYTDYVEKLTSGDKSVKINAGAIYPHDILSNVPGLRWNNSVSDVERNSMIAQWNALPNFIGDASILPMVDVSGSMNKSVGGSTQTTCMDVAVALGLYCAEKNTGNFSDAILTFSERPQLIKPSGDIIERTQQLARADWGMSTDLHSAFDLVLKTAVDNNVPQEEMPEILLVLSDMQFNACTEFDDSAHQMILRKYKDAGYNAPQLVFWNLYANETVPVKFDEIGTALVSGFSPSILKAILGCNFEEFTPEAIMLQTIMNIRYNY